MNTPIDKPENYSPHAVVSDRTVGLADMVEHIDYSRFPVRGEIRGCFSPNSVFGPLTFPCDDMGTPVDVKNPNPKDAIAINKLPLHLVSPFVKAYQSIAHFLGNIKYGAWNYRGSNVRASVYVAALMRHVDAWCEGQEDDPTDGTPHLANALACLGIIIDAKHNGCLIDDRQIQKNFAEYAALRSHFEDLMVKIRKQYASSSPKHFTREQV
jgi:hypothetical protein